ncbi:MAG: PAS domain-containing protein [Holosporales bacterium]
MEVVVLFKRSPGKNAFFPDQFIETHAALVLDHSGKIVHFNKKFETQFKGQCADIVGHPYKDFLLRLSVEQKDIAQIEHALAQGSSFTFNQELKLDADVHSFQAAYNPIIDGNNSKLILVLLSENLKNSS